MRSRVNFARMDSDLKLQREELFRRGQTEGVPQRGSMLMSALSNELNMSSGNLHAHAQFYGVPGRPGLYDGGGNED